jgi:hypothetical protein
MDSVASWAKSDSSKLEPHSGWKDTSALTHDAPKAKSKKRTVLRTVKEESDERYALTLYIVESP